MFSSKSIKSAVTARINKKIQEAQKWYEEFVQSLDRETKAKILIIETEAEGKKIDTFNKIVDSIVQ